MVLLSWWFYLLLLVLIFKKNWWSLWSQNFLESFDDLQNVASLSLFYRYYFGRCLCELVQLVSIPYSWGSSTGFFNRLHDFSVNMSMSTIYFLAQLDSGILYLLLWLGFQLLHSCLGGRRGSIKTQMYVNRSGGGYQCEHSHKKSF